jgi:hypothetical protein
MIEDKHPWWAHVILATIFAGCFAAVPFWTRGLSLHIASIAAMFIFPSMIVVYISVMRGK